MESQNPENNSFTRPLFEERLVNALRSDSDHPNAPERSFPIEGVELVEIYYYFMRGSLEYDAERAYFNKVRGDFLQLAMQHEGLRSKIRAVLYDQRLEAIEKKQHSFDDDVVDAILQDPSFGEKKLKKLGVTDDDLWFFAQDHPFIDKNWLKGLLKTETPRPYGRGFSECKLRLSIVFLTLILDVISHGFFAHAYC